MSVGLSNTESRFNGNVKEEGREVGGEMGITIDVNLNVELPSLLLFLFLI